MVMGAVKPKLRNPYHWVTLSCKWQFTQLGKTKTIPFVWRTPPKSEPREFESHLIRVMRRLDQTNQKTNRITKATTITMKLYGKKSYL